jgi:sortase (surface protein transpeptidase)
MAAALAGLALLAAACGASTEDRAAGDADSPSPALADQATPSPTATDSGEGEALSARTASGESTGQAEQPGDPVSVDIPAIDVQSSLVRLGLNDDRSMEVPDSFDVAGWYTHGPQPGEIGPAVIAGHVSSEAGPGVFYRLNELEPGQQVHVSRANGQRVTYTVDRVEQHPKKDFPSQEVYGDTQQPELRLITCGGAFDEQADSHRDNIIVFATRA